MDFFKIVFGLLMLLLSSIIVESKKIPMISRVVFEYLEFGKDCPSDWDHVICTKNVYFNELFEFKSRCLLDAHQACGRTHEMDGRKLRLINYFILLFFLNFSVYKFLHNGNCTDDSLNKL